MKNARVQRPINSFLTIDGLFCHYVHCTLDLLCFDLRLNLIQLMFFLFIFDFFKKQKLILRL